MKVSLNQLELYKQRRQQLRDSGVHNCQLNSEAMERVAYGATRLAWLVMVNEVKREIRSKGRYRVR